jgi:iron complex transport system substrate-binding protein
MKHCVGLGLLAWALSAAQATEFVDDSASRHRFATPPQRVATLAPSLTELVFAAGAGDRLVASVQGSNFPEAARRVESVGDYQRIDVERLLRLKPDVVLVWSSGNSQRELAQLVSAGVPVVHLEPRRLPDVPRAIERLGALFGTLQAAQAQATAVREQLAALAREHQHKPPVRVFYQVWSQPLMTLNDQHLISNVIALCGGRNVFGALKTLVPQVSTESVLAARPEVILSARDSDSKLPAGARREPAAPAFATWRPFATSMPAAQQGWMFTLPGDQISRQGPRIGEGAQAMCEAIDQVRRERKP